MRVHLVHCHPLGESLTAHLAGHVAEMLSAAGHEVDWLDLYAHGFDPALSAAERRAHFGAPTDQPDIELLQGRLADAEHLVLVFPTWWFALPAMLKGWFDRVWSPGFAYLPGTPIRPGLKGLRSVTVITTLGSPWWVDRLAMRTPVRKMLKTALIGACAPQARFTMLSLYQAEAMTSERLGAFEARIAKVLKSLR